MASRNLLLVFYKEVHLSFCLLEYSKHQPILAFCSVCLILWLIFSSCTHTHTHTHTQAHTYTHQFWNIKRALFWPLQFESSFSIVSTIKCKFVSLSFICSAHEPGQGASWRWAFQNKKIRETVTIWRDCRKLDT